jgi:hypothetical protein
MPLKNHKLDNIYSFLKENRKYNKQVHIGDYKAALLPYNTAYDKVYSLLYNTLNSQSQLKMDYSSEFFKDVASSPKNLSSMKNFLYCLNNKKDTPLTFDALFEALRKQPSWGDKTAALFVKAVYHCHNGFSKEWKFWDDVPARLSNEDNMYLPVDAVILFLFKQLQISCPNSFKGINDYLQANCPGTSMEVWDDLWFWGFITQRIENKERILCAFNEQKYWNIKHVPKDKKSIDEVTQLAKQFVKLIK